MTLTLTPDTETLLRTVAEGQGVDPAQLHEDLLRRALAEAAFNPRSGAPTPRVGSPDDPLTHLANRDTFQMRMRRQWQESSRTSEPFTVLILDLDGFKQINDADGHGRGDRLLTEIAKALIDKTRAQDFVARLGGDEFAVILPDTSAAGAEQIVRAIRAVMIDHFSDKGQPVTMSIGIAEAPPFVGTADDLLGRAEQALFAEKHQKREDRRGAAAPSPPRSEAEEAEARKQRGRRNSRLIARLDSFETGDPQRQKQELEALQAGLEEARPGQRRLFGEGVNP